MLSYLPADKPTKTSSEKSASASAVENASTATSKTKTSSQKAASASSVEPASTASSKTKTSSEKPASASAVEPASKATSKTDVKKISKAKSKKESIPTNTKSVPLSKSGKPLKSKMPIGNQPSDIDPRGPQTPQQAAPMPVSSPFTPSSEHQGTPTATLSDIDHEDPTEFLPPPKPTRQTRKTKKTVKSPQPPKKKRQRLVLEKWQEDALIEHIREEPRYYDYTRPDYKLNNEKWDDLAKFAKTINLTGKCFKF